MTESTQPSASDIETAADIEKAPLPTRFELARRASVPHQLLRFVVLNLKILKLSREGHGG